MNIDKLLLTFYGHKLSYLNYEFIIMQPKETVMVKPVFKIWFQISILLKLYKYIEAILNIYSTGLM